MRTLNKQVGLPLAQAVALMSVNPCRVMGLAHRRGTLAPGMDADLVFFDDEVNVRAVWIAGEPVAL